MSEEKCVYKFFVGRHEWAWSRRTVGFPIYSLSGEGLWFLDYTTKQPATYESPSRWVLRTYRTNGGNFAIYVYRLDPSDEPGLYAPVYVGEISSFNNYELDLAEQVDIPDDVLQTLKKLSRLCKEMSPYEAVAKMRIDKQTEAAEVVDHNQM